MNNKLQRGFSAILIILVLLGLLVVGGGYYFLKMGGNLSLPSPLPTSSRQYGELAEEVSDSTDSETIQSEFDETVIEDPQSDFNELDSSASGL